MQRKSDSSSPTTLPTSTPTTTRILPLPVASETLSASTTTSILCPESNLTLYTSPTRPSKPFLLLCGRDYHSAQGAIDLRSIETGSMSECITRCAETEGCVGAGWGEHGGVLTCWLKAVLGGWHVSSEWCVAVLDEDVAGLKR
ncbi:hypothetical protein B0T16DRAFT_413946 [Cercophora newfieldiana]|uniref:Apple domain-containing protein n=1 Tax=Cercophora newfieldiana TaxID=92897 RepID=A0AA39Y5Y0_9PEZI|nr:hypothetical protein B0T16DRAFT_413946 [Cercophora newfieldiana]